MQTQPVAKSVDGSRAGIEVRCRAPFAVGVVLWRDEAGQVLATVVAKATYALEPGTSALVDVPDPIRPRDEYWEDGSAASLRFPSDLAPFKAAHEVLVVGHVYAEGNRPTHRAIARLAMVDIEKQIAATASRRFDRNGQLEIGPPETRFPLRYELAPGGTDTENPVGIDATELTPAGGYVLPQLTPPNIEPCPGGHVPLVGLGPVSHSWPARDALLRPQDREWLLDPLRRSRPRGFDPRYFSTAPADQRSAAPFRPGERIILEGLHPSHARLVTNLPGVAPVLRSVGGRRPSPRFVADTLYIDTDRRIATLAFRAIIPLGDEKLLFDLALDGAGERTSSLSVRGDEATTELDRGAFDDVASTHLPFPPSSEPGRVRAPASVEGLPFRPASSPPSSPSVPPPPPSVAPPPPASVPRPALASAPPMEAFAEPTVPPPAPPRTTIGEVQSLLRVARAAAGRAEESHPGLAPSSGSSPEGAPNGAPRTEGKDRFRKAFGGGGERRSPAIPPSPASAGGAKSALDDGPASSRSEGALDAAALPQGAKAASDAAAASGTRDASGMRDVAGKVSLGDRLRGDGRRAIVDLLAYDPGVPNRLRRSKAYAPLLSNFAPPTKPLEVDAPVPAQDPSERARADVLRVLSCGRPLEPGELHASLDALFDDQGDFEIPLLLVEGEVRPTMDAVETLRVAASIAKPFGGNNKRVQAALAAASDALSASATLTSEAAVVLYKQLEASTHDLSLPSRYLADLVDRILLEARSFKKRTLLGAPRIRADFSIGKTSLPIYLPEDVASQLPLLPSVSMTALVELRPREDASESNPDALVAFAIGRVLRARK